MAEKRTAVVGNAGANGGSTAIHDMRIVLLWRTLAPSGAAWAAPDRMLAVCSPLASVRTKFAIPLESSKMASSSLPSDPLYWLFG